MLLLEGFAGASGRMDGGWEGAGHGELAESQGLAVGRGVSVQDEFEVLFFPSCGFPLQVPCARAGQGGEVTQRLKVAAGWRRSPGAGSGVTVRPGCRVSLGKHAGPPAAPSDRVAA